jgi:homoserine O-succinyltransferase/O-acetyltransferase
MPVSLHRDSSGHELLRCVNGLLGRSPVESGESSAGCLEIGLLNNMPDAALQATERQFLTLIDAAAQGTTVRLSLYSLPDIPRAEAGRRHVGSFYSAIEHLWDGHLDGLIITGAEPRTAHLIDEPYWHSLTAVLDWAERNTCSTILSCLAAHAAVRHFDGIDRRRFSEKRFGLFESRQVSRHQLTTGTPARFRMPHSRWNDIPENELSACAYRILRRARDGGVDMFVKQKKSMFVFFQGHPEYETNTLLLEYRRDIGRYLRGETDTYPRIPYGYFDVATESKLIAVQDRGLRDKRDTLPAGFPSAHFEPKTVNPWASAAASIYKSWLTYISAQKEMRQEPVYLINSA